MNRTRQHPVRTSLLMTFCFLAAFSGSAHGDELTARYRAQLAADIAANHAGIFDANIADNEILLRFYRNLSVDDVIERMERSAVSNLAVAETLLQSPGGLTRRDRVYWGMVAQRAGRKAASAAPLFAESRGNLRREINVFESSTVFFEWQDGAKTEAMENLLRLFPTSDPRNDPMSPFWLEALVDRYVMFGGLTTDEKNDVRDALANLDTVELDQPGGASSTVTMLHAGFGVQSQSPTIDCATLLTSTLAYQRRLGTLNLRSIWEENRHDPYRTDESYEELELHRPERDRWIELIAQDLIPINPYKREWVEPGDILFSRFTHTLDGHPVVVINVNRQDLTANILGLAGTVVPRPEAVPRGALHERELELSLNAKENKVRYIRPGLWALRVADSAFDEYGNCEFGTRGGES